MVSIMIKNICVDSNIVVKLITHEEDSDLAERLYSSVGKLFVSPVFARYEIFSVLRKKIWKGEIKEEAKAKQATNYLKQLKINYILEEPSDIEDAYDLAKGMNLPVIYDCLYLVLAKKLNIPFVTEDKKFLAKAKKVYSQAFSLKEVVGKI